MVATEKLNLFCVDGSDICAKAFEWYCSNLHRDGDTIGLVHVYQTPVVPVPLGGDNMIYDAGLYDQLLQDAFKTSQHILAKYKSKCTDLNIKHEEFFQHMNDSVGHTICSIAHEKDAKNIIMGQRGLGVVRRTLLGSTSDYVVHHSHLPTIIIPHKE
ncbi:universal stress protein MSMEG_3950/MSMEI_3859-like isoform X2 [Clytia hemisphaerica]|uniref:universal stress protein MSMEG_3950/MSMEI_3859-like isoform X2 n=1 Tax=Clytia hemisphaerica TaxID=252671 RepID=UPI0034D4590E